METGRAGIHGLKGLGLIYRFLLEDGGMDLYSRPSTRRMKSWASALFLGFGSVSFGCAGNMQVLFRDKVLG